MDGIVCVDSSVRYGTQDVSNWRGRGTVGSPAEPYMTDPQGFSSLDQCDRLVQFLLERVDVDCLGDLLCTCLEHS